MIIKLKRKIRENFVTLIKIDLHVIFHTAKNQKKASKLITTRIAADVISNNLDHTFSPLRATLRI